MENIIEQIISLIRIQNDIVNDFVRYIRFGPVSQPLFKYNAEDGFENLSVV